MAETGTPHKQKVLAHVEERLRGGRRRSRTRGELITLYKRFLKIENHRIKMLHRAGGSGEEITRKRSDLLDAVLQNLFTETLDNAPPEDLAKATRKSDFPFTLVAVGGYGRGTLNPGSDVDLLFLTPQKTQALPQSVVDLISDILTMLYDVGFKVGHAVRSIPESVKQANSDNPTKTAMLDSRFVIGDESLYHDYEKAFWSQCIEGRESDYLDVRRRDFLDRHKKYGKTVYLQEPNVKEGCGGLRDYQNIIWVIKVKFGMNAMQELVDRGMLTKTAFRAMQKAHDFLLRVRNELHWAERPCTDILTLRLQGLVATGLGYPQEAILRRIEVFMRDYYRHTRAIYMHSTSLMQSFRLLQEDERPAFTSFLARLQDREQRFDGFMSRGGLVYPASETIFEEDPHRMMRLFDHTQRRGLRLSPEIRKLFKKNYHHIDKTFRYSDENRKTFEAILSRRGSVGRILRQMHRIGFLGKYLPEFGSLECLVQHEFFHRYTADEHTLRCIDALDSLADANEEGPPLLKDLFRRVEDPYALYLALILHDTGRAENHRYHTDGSAMLASQVCARLQIKGERRRLVLFLVDHHLSFWKTATTKNLDDPETIAAFAAQMQNRSYMEALLVMTYADSRGTNDEAWSSWKEMLMTQLYKYTRDYMKDRQAFVDELAGARAELKEATLGLLDADYAAEIEAHFDQMPQRYFAFREAESVVRHLKLFRRYLQSIQEEPGLASLHPAMEWTHFPGQGYSQLELCCWDRTLILAKVAGAFAANELNVLGADIFTRGDNLVLDTFRVCTTQMESVTSKRVQDRVETLINELLDTTRDVREIIQSLPPPKAPNEGLVESFPTRTMVTNNDHPRYTVMEVQALDRLGLLYDILRTIGDFNLEVVNARISTEKGAALDTFLLHDGKGGKITDPKVIQHLRETVQKAIRPS